MSVTPLDPKWLEYCILNIVLKSDLSAASGLGDGGSRYNDNMLSLLRHGAGVKAGPHNIIVYFGSCFTFNVKCQSLICDLVNKFDIMDTMVPAKNWL